MCESIPLGVVVNRDIQCQLVSTHSTTESCPRARRFLLTMININDLLHNKDERIIYILRHHWIVYVFPGLVALLLAVIPFFVAGFLANTSFVIGANATVLALTSIFLSMYYLGTWLFLFTTFHHAHLDTWIVTSHRIIYIEQRQLFSRTVSEQPLSRVQDVTSEVHGVFSTLLGYGDIIVQTAGAVPKFKFTTIPNPADVSRTIFQLVDDAHKTEQKPASAA